MNSNSPVHFYKVETDFSLEGKKYIGFFAYTRDKIYKSVKTARSEYMVVSASFTGFSIAQNTLYIRLSNSKRDGAIGSILPEKLFSLVEDIIYTYNEGLGISRKETPRVGLDEKLFTIED